MFFLRNAVPADVPQIMKIEDASFIAPIRESADVFAARIDVFPEGFVVFSEAVRADAAAPLAGYLCGELWRETPEAAADLSVGHDIACAHCAGGSVFYISSFALLPEFRGKGNGRQLFARAVEYACGRCRRVSELALLVNEEWTGARRIYTDFGFSEVRRIPQMFPADGGGSRTGIVMTRPWSGR